MESPAQGPPPDEGPPPDGERPRAGIGLRISLYLLACLIVLQIGLVGLLALVDPAAFEELRVRGDLEAVSLGVLLALNAALAPVVVVLTLAVVHFFERRDPREIGAGLPRPTGPSFLGALATPLLVLGGWLLATSLLADLSFGREEIGVDPAAAGPGLGTLVLFGLGFLLSATSEEWMFRGYVFSTLRIRFAWIHAAGVTAFLQLMLQWTASSEAASLANLFLIALGLGALRELTGSVWPGVIFQASWNLLLGSVLSLPVSGFEAPQLFDVVLEGDRAWTGGSYGPEASWSLTSFLLVVLVLLVGPLAERDEAEAEAEEGDRE